VHSVVLEKAIDAAVLGIFGLLIIYLLNEALSFYAKGGRYKDAGPISRIFLMLSISILAIFILGYVGVNISGILVSAGFLGIVIGLASQTTLGNLFAGITIMATKPFQDNDRITFSTWQYNIIPPSYSHDYILPGHSGVVDEIGLMYTSMTLENGTRLYVPNGILIQSVVLNHTRTSSKYIRVRAGLAHGVDFAKFRSRLMHNIKNNKLIAGKIKVSDIEVIISDINSGEYGVEIRARHVPAVEEEKIKEALNEAVEKSASKAR
jgi:small-conductance mechanosensitive channel